LERLLAPFPDRPGLLIGWGMNCASGPDALLTAAERAMRFIDKPLVVQPNAGMPRDVDGRKIYLCSPDYLAGYAKRYLDLGVRGIGGCCGTTPEHIKEIARRIKPLAKKPGRAAHIEVAAGVTPKEATPFAKKSRLAWKLAHGKWVASVELLPPRGYDLADTIAKAKALHRHGADAINIPDGPRASSRLSPLVTAMSIQREAQIEVILHFCCRDRNLIGMQADLLACAACEIRNILFVTGDPPKLGNYPFASGVFDMDSIGLCGVQKRLNQGIDLGGQGIDPQTHAVIGVGADPTALDQEREIRRFDEKVEAGAEFAITQPVFDVEALFRFLDRVQRLGIPTLAGVWPLASYRNAVFLKNEVPGVVVPDTIMERMAAVSTKEDQCRVGIEIARESIERIRGRVAGIQVSPPFGNVRTALAVIE
jgi:homocysteine S-methyltransferase